MNRKQSLPIFSNTMTQMKRRWGEKVSTGVLPGVSRSVICGFVKMIAEWKKMACWKWFGNILKEAGIEVTDENRVKVDDVIHQYIGEQSSYGRCSADWRKARKEIQADEQMRGKLVEKLKSLT